MKCDSAHGINLPRGNSRANRGFPRATPFNWPGLAPFALFLSHDIDQVYDRELFRILGDLNHLMRMIFGDEAGQRVPCAKRISRCLLRPKPPGLDIESILAIERRVDFRSTFFLLEDGTFNRLGGRYSYADSAIRKLARNIEANDCEIAVHGAYHNFNDAEAYRAQSESFRSAFGRDPSGIRNHDLRHDGELTWIAQREAGFRYDASFGSNGRVGFRDGINQPFFPIGTVEDNKPDFVELPMTIMDGALFRSLGLGAEEALEECRRIVDRAANEEGLLSLNWHNNYFEEEEYKDWQQVYEQLVGLLSEQDLWNATGEEIADWWIRRSGVRMTDADGCTDEWVMELSTALPIDGFGIRIVVPDPDSSVIVNGTDATIESSATTVKICFPTLRPADNVRVSIRRPFVGGVVE